MNRIAINARGCRAASYTGSQAGIITETAHGQAKIIEIRPKRILEALEAGNVVIIAGFQGLSSAYEITTLGRGGSDLTAVAMAAGVGAEVCEIYTDVGGVMTADPRAVSDARLIERIGYDDMLELAAAGAKVLQSRSDVSGDGDIGVQGEPSGRAHRGLGRRRDALKISNGYNARAPSILPVLSVDVLPSVPLDAGAVKGFGISRSRGFSTSVGNGGASSHLGLGASPRGFFR